MCVLENNKIIDAETIRKYLPTENHLPVLVGNTADSGMSERDIFYSVLFELKKDVSDLKKVVYGLIQNQTDTDVVLPAEPRPSVSPNFSQNYYRPIPSESNNTIFIEEGPKEEIKLSLEDQEKEIIKRALQKYKGRRNRAAKELGISERTLYRKIKQYGFEDVED